MDQIVNVILVDNRELMRIGIKNILMDAPGLEVVGEASSCADVIGQTGQTDQTSPSVVVVGSVDDQPTPIDAVRVLVESATGRDRHYLGLVEPEMARAPVIRESLAYTGQLGFVLSRARPQEIVSAIRMLIGGYSFFSGHARVRESERSATNAASGEQVTNVTDREREVLHLLAKGCSNTDISERLRLRESTVKSHVQSLLVKLGLKNRVSAVIYAYEKGLIRVGENDFELPQRYDQDFKVS